ncbi:protein of unknown function [Tenacibaculum aestuariivivum]
MEAKTIIRILVFLVRYINIIHVYIKYINL